MATGLTIKQKSGVHPLKWLVGLLLVSIIAAAAYFAARWFMTGETIPLSIVKASNIGVPAVDESDVASSQILAHSVPTSQPRYIAIPSIGVSETRIFSIGLTKNNVLDVPKNLHDAGWFSKSATPGSGYGAVLINAHSVGHEKLGAFANLGQLTVGEIIHIERGDGKKFSYKVVSNETMSLQDAIPAGMRKMTVSADSTKEGLNLMTFAGNYIPRLGQFEKRVMVRAVIE